LNESTSSKTDKHRNHKGMSWPTAAIFIIGDMVGGGMIALPIAVVNAGLLPGITLIILAAIFTGYTGIQLGDNWTLMQRRWPEYKSHCRRPYPEMAYRAMGQKAMYLVAFCLCLTQFGMVTVLLLLAANNVSNLLTALFGMQINFCYVILIIGLVLWPFIMLKSPMHFWWVTNERKSRSKKFSLLAGIFNKQSPCCYFHHTSLNSQVVTYPEFSLKNFFLAYGTIAFAYGGHGAFPTIQHDMTKPFRFNRAVWTSYILILIVYIAVSIAGYMVYGASMRNTVIPSIQIEWLSQLVNVMITLHVLPTVVIVFSPLAQQVELWTGVPSRHFSTRRFITRSLIFVGIVFTAETIPHFGVFLDLVGGSTVTLMTMLLPSVFYLFLFASYKKRVDLIICSAQRFYVVPPNLVYSVFGLIGGIAATSSALTELLDAKMAPPCYVQWFTSGLSMPPPTGGSTHCCGPYMNVTVSGTDPSNVCLMSDYV
uniref:Aa_trans domain-containing protein n=1 Tax=Angiostrongylus cantonensis TaxID=6313 RepID=A0A0K0CV09_ANGCA